MVKKLKRAKYIETDDTHRSIKTIYCKVTGNKISGYTIGDEPFARDVRNNKIIEKYLVSPKIYSNYREVTILMEDGNKHVTPVCKSAIELIQEDKELMMAVYQADIDQFEVEGMDKKYLEKLRKAKPTEVLEIT